jgi:hypothetical protein
LIHTRITYTRCSPARISEHKPDEGISLFAGNSTNTIDYEGEEQRGLLVPREVDVQASVVVSGKAICLVLIEQPCVEAEAKTIL